MGEGFQIDGSGLREGEENEVAGAADVEDVESIETLLIRANHGVVEAVGGTAPDVADDGAGGGEGFADAMEKLDCGEVIGDAVSTVGVEEDEVVGLGGFLNELTSVGDLGMESVIGFEAEELFGDADDFGVDIDDIDGGIGVVMVEEGGDGSAAEADDEDALGVGDEGEADEGGADVGEFDVVGVIELDDALTCAVSFEEQGSQTVLILGNHDRIIVGLGFVDDLGLGCGDPSGEESEGGEAGEGGPAGEEGWGGHGYWRSFWLRVRSWFALRFSWRM